MSMAPLQVDGTDARFGVSLGAGLKLRDSLWDGLTDQHAGIPMGITAENLAEKYNISRQVMFMPLLLFEVFDRLPFILIKILILLSTLTTTTIFQGL